MLRAGKDADGVGGANCQSLYSATWRICYPLARLFSAAVLLVVPLVLPAG